MGSFRLSMPRDASFSLVFSDIPTPAKHLLRNGYSVIANASEEQRTVLLRVALESFEEGGPPPSENLAKQIGLAVSDAEIAVGATMLLASGIASPESREGPENLVEEMIKAKLIDPSNKIMIEAYAESLKKQADTIRSRLDRAQLASRVLPAYSTMHTAVDIRVDFGEKRMAVPVGLVHIGTDDTDADIKFQVSSAQLSTLIRRLQELHSQMGAVEKLAHAWEKTKE
jgi:hypothetical protein